ncbi:MAG: response regulator transcription factor [Bacillati bacterium]
MLIEPSVPTIPVRVRVVAQDPTMASLLARLLDLDRRIAVAPVAMAGATIAPQPPSDVTVLLSSVERAGPFERYQPRTSPRERLLLLDELRERTIGELLDAISSLAPTLHQHYDTRKAPQTQAYEPERSTRAVRVPLGQARLSPREVQITRLICQGLSNKDIGKELGLSDKTIKNHVSHILAKTKTPARTALAVAALRAGIV